MVSRKVETSIRTEEAGSRINETKKSIGSHLLQAGTCTIITGHPLVKDKEGARRGSPPTAPLSLTNSRIGGGGGANHSNLICSVRTNMASPLPHDSRYSGFTGSLWRKEIQRTFQHQNAPKLQICSSVFSFPLREPGEWRGSQQLDSRR